jgi:glycosyltransferase involved in cell wall biosynthesis
MKIAFYVADVSVPAGHEDVASAHVKVPLHCLQLLRDAGHTVHLITTETPERERLPGFMPAGVVIHQVTDLQQRGRNGVAARLRPLGVLAHLSEIRRIVARERYDVVHFHGFRNTPDVAALVGLWGIKTPFIVTVNDSDLPTRFWFVRRHLWKRIAAFVTSTEFVRDRLHLRGIRADVVKHGAVRDLAAEAAAVRDIAAEATAVRNIEAELGAHPAPQGAQRVLFWRDPSLANGIDVCLKAYSQLAPRFPHINFDVAVRTHREDWTAPLEALAAAHPNVGVHKYPYAEGTTLAQLLAESVCVLLPFRTLSYHPQLAVLESIQFGRTVITTALGSNTELADGGRHAIIVPVGDVAATVAAVEAVLRDPSQANEFARDAAQSARAAWNWDSYVTQIEQTYRQAAGACSLE